MDCAIRLSEFGGPDVLRVERSDPGAPGPNEVRLRQTAIGVNFIDIVQRRGVSPIALSLPSGIGGEAAGIIEEVGSAVRGFNVGDRVAYANVYGGAYASVRLLKPDALVPLPDEISDRQAAGMMLKGLTAWCLVRQVFDVKAGDVVLIHAAAGGVGSIVCQWLRQLGATVIGTVSSDEKVKRLCFRGDRHHGREEGVRRIRQRREGDLPWITRLHKASWPSRTVRAGLGSRGACRSSNARRERISFCDASGVVRLYVDALGSAEWRP